MIKRKTLRFLLLTRFSLFLFAVFFLFFRIKYRVLIFDIERSSTTFFSVFYGVTLAIYVVISLFFFFLFHLQEASVSFRSYRLNVEEKRKKKKKKKSKNKIFRDSKKCVRLKIITLFSII